MKAIGVFVDTNNLYYCVSKNYHGRKLDYQKYLNRAKSEHHLYQAYAYVSQPVEQASRFIDRLNKLGFVTKIIEGDYAGRVPNNPIEITTDIVRIIDKLDIVVLGITNTQYIPLIDFIQSKGVQCVILASGIPKVLKEKANYFREITRDLLEEDNEDATT